MYDTSIKDARNLFRLKKETDDSTVKYRRNLFRLKKNKAKTKMKIK